jgi:type IV pilus assembly protein PilE
MKTTASENGFTLIELMITVGIVGVLSAVAFPAYQGYVETSATRTAEANAKILSGFEDNYFYENDTYLAGTYSPPGANGLSALDWTPSGDQDKYDYMVEAGTTGNISSSYTITVTYKANTSYSASVSKP